MTKVSISIVDMDLPVDVHIKTEICELLTKFEAVEVGMHEVLANTDSNEHIRRLNTIFTLLNKELTQMANNKHKKKLLTSSRRFKMHMDHFWKNFEDYELKFGTTHDNTEQNDKIIGSLAWFRVFIRMLQKQNDLLAVEINADRLYVSDVGLQFHHNLSLLDKVRQMAQDRYPNADQKFGFKFI